MDKTGCWKVEDSTYKANGHSSRTQGRYPPLDHFLETLVESRLLETAQLKGFLADRPGLSSQDTSVVVEALVAQGLLTDYQMQWLLAGEPFGLVIGNYRVLDWLGQGGMGVVYKAEHIHMKRPVALKVLAAEIESNAVFLERFTSEMQALATLHHPNIVEAFDAGEVAVPSEPGKSLRYLVMEFVQGVDLERHVTDHGPLPIAVACDYIRQAANGLHHANERGMVHRDVKPSNLLVTNMPADLGAASGAPWPNGQLKILDFGLARLYGRRYTEAYTVLGTIDYMAPEQARDARSVDVRADIYGLGGTLYWLLTGQRPFPGDRPVVQELMARQHETPASVRSLRNEIPLELESVVCQMMALDPNDRYPTPLAVVAALNQFLEPSHRSESGLTVVEVIGAASACRSSDTLSAAGIIDLHTGDHSRRVLILSPRTAYRSEIREVLEKHGMSCAEADGAADLHNVLKRFPADVALIDAHLKGETGVEICRQLRAQRHGFPSETGPADGRRIGRGRFGFRRRLRRPGARRRLADSAA